MPTPTLYEEALAHTAPIDGQFPRPWMSDNVIQFPCKDAQPSSPELPTCASLRTGTHEPEQPAAPRFWWVGTAFLLVLGYLAGVGILSLMG
ncbi:hypothetical protein [Ruegeria sp. HKCCD7318]|uniref:hypothetical protein n=1 Tax=Ruegeria sp. HKCCD7318 TaxID=2683014 RepID=UPI001492D605|nr:hypothetical protein [Ruegeria sp. HKCCD7318]NOE32497.1 hypothetical protein [Ruegeria sp. HKCCD7318]